MSDTPRTDAAAVLVSINDDPDQQHPKGPYVPREVSEKLERENAALRADNKRLEEDRRYLFNRPEYVSIEKLERENSAFRNEIARLSNQTNWVCKCGGTDCAGQAENAALRMGLQKLASLQFGVHGVCESHLTLYGPTVRDIACAAIDAARKEAQP